MQTLIGLGNPDEEYALTRHNVGFRVVDEIAKRLKIKLELNAKFSAEVGKSKDILLVKPQTYMNGSGQSVQAVMNFYKLSVEKLTVIHDDLDLPLGSYKIQFGHGPKEHNGLLSIYEALGTKDFTHARIGIDGRGGDKTLPGKTYVLQKFSGEEEEIIKTVIQTVAEKLT